MAGQGMGWGWAVFETLWAEEHRAGIGGAQLSSALPWLFLKALLG